MIYSFQNSSDPVGGRGPPLVLRASSPKVNARGARQLYEHEKEIAQICLETDLSAAVGRTGHAVSSTAFPGGGGKPSGPFPRPSPGAARIAACT